MVFLSYYESYVVFFEERGRYRLSHFSVFGAESMSLRKRSSSKSRPRNKYSRGTRRQFKRGATTNSTRKFGVSASRGHLVRGAEYKSVDIDEVMDTIPVATAAADNHGMFEWLNLTSLGTGAMNRIGNRVTGVSLRVRGFFRARSGAITQAYNSQPIRMLIVYDKNPGFLAPATVPQLWYQDIMQDTSPAAAASSTSTALPNVGNRDRYIILADETFVGVKYDAAGAGVASDRSSSCFQGAGMDNIAWFEKYIKLNKLETIWKNNAASSDAFVTGAIGILLYMDYTGLANEATGSRYQLVFSSRYVYQDV